MNLEQNIFVAHQNTVRKAWVSLIPDNIKAMFAAMPQEERFEHYRRIDVSVSTLYRFLLKESRKQGNKINETENNKLINSAAQRVVDTLTRS